jgi:heavy metal sensor kinase
MRPLGLRTKLTLIYTALFALVLAALGAVTYRTLAALLDNRLDEQLEEMAAGLRRYVRFPGGKPSLAYDPDDAEQTFFAQTAGRYLEVYDANTGELLYQSPEMDVLDLDLSPDEVRGVAQNLGTGEIENERIHLRVHNTLIRQARHTYLLRVGLSLSPTFAALHQFQRTLLLIVPVGLLMAASAGWGMARLALRPVKELGQAAHEISISRLDHRLPLRGSHDELDRLASTFNEVFARLQQAVQQMREFTASVSHELRTPLAALRGEAEVALATPRPVADYQRILESQLEEFDKLSRMVNELLTLARAEAGEIHLRADHVDLASLVRSGADLLRPLAEERRLSLVMESESAVEVTGDPQWLEPVVLNLLDNAIKFTEPGGTIGVRVGSEGGKATLIVSDTGVGISAEALPHIFEPFYRADSSRSKQVAGVGLGLALVRWIVDAHGGSMRVKSQPGAGTCVTVLLPLGAVQATTQASATTHIRKI